MKCSSVTRAEGRYLLCGLRSRLDSSSSVSILQNRSRRTTKKKPPASNIIMTHFE